MIRVVDVKTPGSGEEARNRYEQLQQLAPNDQVKFVICIARRLRVEPRAAGELQRSPSAAACCSRRATSSCRPRELADWILADRLPVRFQIQLHKYLWGENVAAEKARRARRRAAVRRARLGHRAGLGARAGLRVLRAVGRLRPASRAELEAAARVARACGAHEHRIMHVDLARIGGSALTDPGHRGARAAEQRNPGHLRAGAQHHAAVAGAGLGRGAGGAAHCHRRQRGRLLAAIRTAGRSSSRPSRRWRTSPPRRAWRERAADARAAACSGARSRSSAKACDLGVDYAHDRVLLPGRCARAAPAGAAIPAGCGATGSRRPASRIRRATRYDAAEDFWRGSHEEDARELSYRDSRGAGRAARVRHTRRAQPRAVSRPGRLAHPACHRPARAGAGLHGRRLCARRAPPRRVLYDHRTRPHATSSPRWGRPTAIRYRCS